MPHHRSCIYNNLTYLLFKTTRVFHSFGNNFSTKFDVRILTKPCHAFSVLTELIATEQLQYRVKITYRVQKQQPR
jgi:hypothetical protein